MGDNHNNNNTFQDTMQSVAGMRNEAPMLGDNPMMHIMENAANAEAAVEQPQPQQEQQPQPMLQQQPAPKRKRPPTRRRRDAKAPRPPRTALELYQLDRRKDFISKHSAAAIPKDFATQKAKDFDKLSQKTLQAWKVAEAEDLVRYHRQIQFYQPPEGYDMYGNLITENNNEENKESSEESPAKKAKTTNTNSILENGEPQDTSKISIVPAPTLTLPTASFNDLTFELVKFRILKGHARVPVKRGGLLGKWVDKLRKEYKKMKNGDDPSPLSQPDNLRLTDERIQVLSHLGMVWEFPNEDYEEIWQTHFQELVEFKEKNGHCNVPQKGKGKLSWWVKVQRELWANTTQNKEQLAPRSRPRQTMPAHRMQQLESIGFEWRVRPHALKWEDRFQELLDYKETYGDCNVPQNYPPNRVLGKWVMKQRGFYYDKLRGKKSPLTEDRQKKLQDAGFAWVAPHITKTKTKLPLRDSVIQQQQTTNATQAVAGDSGEKDNGTEEAKQDDGSHQGHAPTEQQQQQQGQAPSYILPPQPHMAPVGDPTQAFRAYAGPNDPTAAAAAYHHPPPLETAAAMHHLTTDPEHHQPHRGLQQPPQGYPHHAAPPHEQHVPYPTAGQVAASTYPYVTNNNQEGENPHSHQLEHQEQQGAAQPANVEGQEQQDLAEGDPTAPARYDFPPL